MERRNAVFQDRLVKELRLRGISDMAQANALLEQVFLPDLNGRFAVTPRRETDLHRSLPPDLALGEILCVQEERVVGHDWCLRWHNRRLQIPAGHAKLDLAGKRVVVRQLGDGTLVLTYRGDRLTYRLLACRPVRAIARSPSSSSDDL